MMSECETQIQADLQRFALFEGLDAPLLERLGRAASYKEARKGEQIYRQGEAPRALYCVVTGHVRRAMASPEGDERVIDILSPGRCFGLAEVFDASPYASFAEVVEPAVLLRVGKEGLMEAIAEHPSLALRLLGMMARQQSSFERDVAACFFQSGSARLVDYLLREAEPILQSEGDTILELPVSKRLIAARIGITAETLSRAFRELSDADLISVSGRKIVLREKLSCLAANPMGFEADAGLPRWGRRQSDRWGRRAVGSRATALM